MPRLEFLTRRASFVQSQSKSPSLLVNLSQLFTPSRTTGAVSASPALLTNTSTIYAPTAALEDDIQVNRIAAPVGTSALSIGLAPIHTDNFGNATVQTNVAALPPPVPIMQHLFNFGGLNGTDVTDFWSDGFRKIGGTGAATLTSRAVPTVTASATWTVSGTAPALSDDTHGSLVIPDATGTVICTIPTSVPGTTSKPVVVENVFDIGPADLALTRSISTVFRWNNNSNFMSARLSVAATTGGASFAIRQNIAGTETVVGSATANVSHTASRIYMIRVTVTNAGSNNIHAELFDMVTGDRVSDLLATSTQFATEDNHGFRWINHTGGKHYETHIYCIDWSALDTRMGQIGDVRAAGSNTAARVALTAKASHFPAAMQAASNGQGSDPIKPAAYKLAGALYAAAYHRYGPSAVGGTGDIDAVDIVPFQEYAGFFSHATLDRTEWDNDGPENLTQPNLNADNYIQGSRFWAVVASRCKALSDDTAADGRPQVSMILGYDNVSNRWGTDSRLQPSGGLDAEHENLYLQMLTRLRATNANYLTGALITPDGIGFDGGLAWPSSVTGLTTAASKLAQMIDNMDRFTAVANHFGLITNQAVANVPASVFAADFSLPGGIATTLPIYNYESYIFAYTDGAVAAPNDRPDNLTDQMQGILHLYKWVTELQAGMTAAYHWKPEGDDNDGPDATVGGSVDNLQGLYRDITNSATTLPAYDAFVDLMDNFPPGTAYYDVTNADADLFVLASATKTLVGNLTSGTKNFTAEGSARSIGAYDWAVYDAV